MLRVAEAVHRTDTGRQREANEDAYFARAPVFAVADGMGGAQAGEVASRIAVDAFEPERADDVAPERYLSETAQRANREIFDIAQGDVSRSGMGTTLTAALLVSGEVSIAHVGDSRAYRLRDGEMAQLTNDHSLVEELRRQGKLTSDQAADHPQRSVITRALGPEPRVVVDTMTVPANAGDVFVLCSDGLTTMLSDEEIAEIIGAADGLEEASRTLVREANERGGRDNITVVMFRVEEVAGAAPAADEETLVGTAAAAEGLTAEAVREGSEAQRRSAGATAAEAPREPRPSPEAPSRPDGPRRRWLRRAGQALAVVAIVSAVGYGAYYGARQVWFLGSDEAGRVALYRGLPYELPLGLDLYSEVRSAPVTVDALPADRRDEATNHELRSRDDAVSLIEDLERSAEEASAMPEPERGGARRRPGTGGTGAGPARGGPGR